jgi:hypothetical protein
MIANFLHVAINLLQKDIAKISAPPHVKTTRGFNRANSNYPNVPVGMQIVILQHATKTITP